MKKQSFDITGMTCSACSTHIEKAVNKVKGVNIATVSLMSNSMTVEYDESILSDSDIVRVIQNQGYGATVKGQKKISVKKDDELESMKWRLIISFVFMLPHMYVSMGHMASLPVPAVFHDPFVFSFTQLLLTLPVMYVNRKYYEVGFKSLFRGSPNMDSLIAVGSSSAFVYGIVVMYRLGHAMSMGDLTMAHHHAMDTCPYYHG